MDILWRVFHYFNGTGSVRVCIRKSIDEIMMPGVYIAVWWTRASSFRQFTDTNRHKMLSKLTKYFFLKFQSTFSETRQLTGDLVPKISIRAIPLILLGIFVARSPDEPPSQMLDPSLQSPFMPLTSKITGQSYITYFAPVHNLRLILACLFRPAKFGRNRRRSFSSQCHDTP